jgi:hypothetical protein
MPVVNKNKSRWGTQWNKLSQKKKRAMVVKHMDDLLKAYKLSVNSGKRKLPQNLTDLWC